MPVTKTASVTKKPDRPLVSRHDDRTERKRQPMDDHRYRRSSTGGVAAGRNCYLYVVCGIGGPHGSSTMRWNPYQNSYLRRRARSSFDSSRERNVAALTLRAILTIWHRRKRVLGSPREPAVCCGRPHLLQHLLQAGQRRRTRARSRRLRAPARSPLSRARQVVTALRSTSGSPSSLSSCSNVRPFVSKPMK